MQQLKEPLPIERLLSAATYLTAGGVGVIWLIIAAVKKRKITKFLMYHIMQSIFLSFVYFLLSALSTYIFIILYRVPAINAIPFLLNTPLPFLFNLSLIQAVTTSILLYLTITSFLGYYTYIPWVSKNIKNTQL